MQETQVPYLDGELRFHKFLIDQNKGGSLDT